MCFTGNFGVPEANVSDVWTVTSQKKIQGGFFQELIFRRIFKQSILYVPAATHVQLLQVLGASEHSNIAYRTIQKHVIKEQDSEP